MASRRPKKSRERPKKKDNKAPLKPRKGKKRRLSRSKANIARRARYKLLKQPNIEILQRGKRRKAAVRFKGPRDATLNQVKDWLAEYQPKGTSYLYIDPGDKQAPLGTSVGDFLHTIREVDSRALQYIKRKRTTAYDEEIEVDIVLLGY